MTILADYVDSTHFTIEGDYASEYQLGRRVRLAQAEDGVTSASVVTASYNSVTLLTSVQVRQPIVTENLVSVYKGVGAADSMGEHDHTGDGQCGLLPAALLSSSQISTLLTAVDQTDDIYIYRAMMWGA